jgi:hypothetical protein
MDTETKRINAACDMLRLCVMALTGRGGERVETSAEALAELYRISAYNGLAALVSDGLDRLDIEKNEKNARTVSRVCIMYCLCHLNVNNE